MPAWIPRAESPASSQTEPLPQKQSVGAAAARLLLLLLLLLLACAARE